MYFVTLGESDRRTKEKCSYSTFILAHFLMDKDFLDANCDNMDVHTIPENFHTDERTFIFVVMSLIMFIKAIFDFKIKTVKISESTPMMKDSCGRVLWCNEPSPAPAPTPSDSPWERYLKNQLLGNYLTQRKRVHRVIGEATVGEKWRECIQNFIEHPVGKVIWVISPGVRKFIVDEFCVSQRKAKACSNQNTIDKIKKWITMQIDGARKPEADKVYRDKVNEILLAKLKEVQPELMTILSKFSIDHIIGYFKHHHYLCNIDELIDASYKEANSYF